MTAAWILIIILAGDGKAATTAYFDNGANCQVAADQLNEGKRFGHYVQATCHRT